MNSSELDSFKNRFYEQLIEKRNISEEKVDKEILDAASKTKIDSDNSYKVFVYMGTYAVQKINGYSREHITYDDNLSASYKLFYDIETEDKYKISLDRVKEFEQNYDIIYMPVKMQNYYLYYMNFLKAKKEFFKGILSESPDIVVKKLKKGLK